MELLLFIALSIFPTNGAFAATAGEGPPAVTAAPRYEAELHFALFRGTEWTEELVQKHVREAAEVFSQCQLEFPQVVIHHVDLELPQQLGARDPYGKDGLIEISEKTKDLPRPMIYLVNEFSDSGPTPLTRAIFRVNAPPCPLELADTIWVPYYINTDAYLDERKNSPYAVVAHELTHLFTLDGQHNGDVPSNMLSIWSRRTNRLTAEHCQEIHESPHVKLVTSSGKN